MRRLILALCLAPTIAIADGVNLIGPAPQMTAQQLKPYQDRHNVRSVVPIGFNRHAIESNIVNITIEGKTYRFAGSRRSGVVEGVDEWSGEAAAGVTAHISRKGDRALGLIRVGRKQYQLVGFGSAGVLMETIPSIGPVESPEAYKAMTK